MSLINILEKDLSHKKSYEGLSESEAKERIRQYGTNELQAKKSVHPFTIFTDQFKDVLVMILLACTAISLFMGEYTEAIAISCIVLANAIMGFAQELKTEKTLEALKNMAAPVAKVYRNGNLCKLPTSEIVCDDVIMVESGDKIPADAVIMESISLDVDESILTGESVPVSKQQHKNEEVQNELNKSYLIHMGTTVTKGRAKAKVIATGMNTQMGKIADMLNEIEDEQTPLQKKLEQLGKYIAIGCLLICAIVASAGILRGEPVLDMLITGVSLSVAAVPEGLPAIVTIALAIAVNRMVKRKALIRKLHAVETLGCASVICSDKTGTLTQNKMTVKKVFTLDGTLEVSGDGYEKAGDFKSDGQRVNIRNDETAQMMMEIAILCNNAEIIDSENSFQSRDRAVNMAKGTHKVLGDPTESALLVMAGKAGVTSKSLETEYEKIDEIPFDSTRKCMSVIAQTKTGKKVVFCKGAYDIIIEKCTYAKQNGGQSGITQAIKQKISRANNQMAGSALRVLGFAYKEIVAGESKENYEKGLTFVGLAGMIDPPRKEAQQAVKTCIRAGIKPVMITGDHKETAVAIAKQVGIFHDGDKVISGMELDRMDENELAKAVTHTTVFARVSPNHKLKIVRAFKKRGHIVAMTGDGVNDAPAIKEADIGVSMGITGTDVTKEASEVILLDDNFATLVVAVEEGRVIYGNIRKFIRYLLSCNIGEVLTMFLGILMGLPVILLPIQILLVNLVTDGFPAIALGLEPAEKDIMKRQPRKASSGIFSEGLLTTIIFRGCLIGLTTLAVFVTLYKMTMSYDLARTGAFLTLVITQLIHVFECKSETKNIFTVPYFSNMKLILAVTASALTVFATIYVDALRPIFSTVPLEKSHLVIVMGYSMIAPIISSVVGMFFNNKKP
ncbi:MAG: ATPase, P-type (transporting), superfamily, subfamily, partial [Oscillospiraceae bacterium]|nr:ATPase, P-type (transporting), superfamily, subfamily [Oscillospiraceae bacterium]